MKIEKISLVVIALVFCLLILTCLTCGCVKQKVYDEHGNWIILPEFESKDDSLGKQISSDFTTGDYKGLVVYSSPESYSAIKNNSLKLNIIFKNKGMKSLEINNFPPEFLIKDPSDISIPFKIVKKFQRGNADIRVMSGHKNIYELEWDLKDDFGEELPYGIYTLEIPDVMVWDGYNEETFRGDLGMKIAEILIRPDKEVMKKIISLNQTKESEELKVIFERIEADENKTELFFSVSYKNPNYTRIFPGGDEFTYKLSKADNLQGYYEIDNHELKYLWNWEYLGTIENCLKYKSMIEPLISDTENISINITGFGPLDFDFNYQAELQIITEQ